MRTQLVPKLTFDGGQSGVTVVVCSCGWRTLRAGLFTAAAAHDAAAEHLRHAHHGHAEHALRNLRRRAQ